MEGRDLDWTRTGDDAMAELLGAGCVPSTVLGA